jgi:hypothetical protein
LKSLDAVEEKRGEIQREIAARTEIADQNNMQGDARQEFIYKVKGPELTAHQKNYDRAVAEGSFKGKLPDWIALQESLGKPETAGAAQLSKHFADETINFQKQGYNAHGQIGTYRKQLDLLQNFRTGLALHTSRRLRKCLLRLEVQP